MSATVEAMLDLFVEQTAGVLLGAAVMTAFEVGCAAGLPAEALVMEMYMSGEMESVFRAFRETGFLRSSHDHGPTAVFGGALRMLELDRETIAERFRGSWTTSRAAGLPVDSRTRHPTAIRCSAWRER
jgi:ketol-acid reductoisomerase